MEEMTLLEKAIALAVDAHAGQKDKVGQPYILHPLRVMLRVQGEEDRVAAILHDVLEDTATTRKQLADLGVPPTVLEALDCLTKTSEEEDYDLFIGRVAQNAMAIRVKLADLDDNMDLNRLPNVTARDQRRLAKYKAAQTRLLSALASSGGREE